MNRDGRRPHVRSVEFLDDAGAADDSTRPDVGSRWRKSGRLFSHSWVSVTASVVMLIGAVVAIVGVFLPQLTFRPALRRSPLYEVNGLGSYRLVGRASSFVSVDAHAPALGAVALAAAAAVLVAGVVVSLRLAPAVVSAVAAGVVCVASGVVAGTFACEAVEGSLPDGTTAVF